MIIILYLYILPSFIMLKDCVGAIDGTHILACIPKDLQILSRRSQLEPTINVLCCCSFVMKFTCVMVGSEGMNDSIIFIEMI